MPETLHKKVISDELLQKKIGFLPHPAQKRIIEEGRKKKTVSVCAGVRFGKTAIAAYEAFKRLISDNQRVWVVSLSYGMAERVMDYIVQFAQNYDKRLLRGYQRRTPQRFAVPEFNSFVECKSIEQPNALLGEELDLIIADEASRFPPEIYQRYLMARLASRQGKFLAISTPFGKNWFYHNHLASEAKFNFTSLDNPYFPREVWERAKKTLPIQVFKQEYEAQFLEDAASVFRGIGEIVQDTSQDVLKGHYYLMGVDLGKHEDFTVLTVIDRETNNVVYFDRFNQIDYPFQKARILATAQRYNRAKIIIDSTVVGEPIKEDLERMGAFVEDFKFSQRSKKEAIEKLSIFIEQKFIKIPNNPILINELESFGYQLSDKGNVIYSAPQGLKDDCVWSLALAVWGLNPGRPLKADPIEAELKRSWETKKKVAKTFI